MDIYLVMYILALIGMLAAVTLSVTNKNYASVFGIETVGFAVFVSALAFVPFINMVVVAAWLFGVLVELSKKNLH